MEQFKVSVIIPVYNAAGYVRQAVESAHMLEEVGEIILIEDCSPDNAFAVCDELTKEYRKVKMFTHPGRVNKGAAASRNLGIEKAQFEFVSFLDADDYYLPNRFTNDARTFQQQPGVDGIYNAIGAAFYSEEGRKKFLKHRSMVDSDLGDYKTMLRKGKGDAYWRLMQGRYGYCHTDGVTFRRQVFRKAGVFNTSLRLHQDTDLWIRICYHCNIVEGSNEVVAMRGVHDDNRIHQANKASKFKYFQSLFQYFKKLPIPIHQKLFLYKRMISYHPWRKYSPYTKGLSRILMSLELAFLAAVLTPEILRSNSLQATSIHK